MQAPLSFGLIATIVGAALLFLVLATVSVYSLIAMPIFVIGFIAFLVTRGKRRAESTLGQRHQGQVPTTEEAAADPVADSGVSDAIRARSRNA